LPADKTPPNLGEGDADFSTRELELMADVRSRLETETATFDAYSRHRVLLGAASELVDAAADLAAVHRPGVRVVELGILAERISQLACAPYETTDE
jgi:hypothetical protein